MPDPVEAVLRYNAGRDPERLALKFASLRRDPFAFLRGTAHLYHARLPRHSVLDGMPLAWCCGDMHLENFGSYKDDDRKVRFDIDDFDEAALAPAGHDIVHLLCSLRVAMPLLGFDAGDRDALCSATASAWADALSEGCVRSVDEDSAEGLIGELLAGLHDRKRVDYLDSRTIRHGGQRRIRTGYDKGKTKALPVSDEDRATVTAFMHEFAGSHGPSGFFEPLDVARRVSGLGSLGLPRYVVLVRGKGSPDGNYLIDIKAAQSSSLAPLTDTATPWQDNAERMTGIQRLMQASPVAFLHAVKLKGRPFVLRGLQPAQDRVSLDDCEGKPARLKKLLQSFARILAWAQLRSSGQAGSADRTALRGITDPATLHGLQEIARDAAGHVERDWQAWCAAFDAGDVPASC